MARVTIQHADINSGVAVRVKCTGVSVGGKKNNNKTPNANGDDLVYVQTQSYENLTYSISGIHYTGESGILSWADVITLYKAKNTSTNYAVLTVTYGDSTQLTGLAGTTDIKVALDTLNFPISTIDSKEAYLPVGSLTFTETK